MRFRLRTLLVVFLLLALGAPWWPDIYRSVKSWVQMSRPAVAPSIAVPSIPQAQKALPAKINWNDPNDPALVAFRDLAQNGARFRLLPEVPHEKTSPGPP